MYFFLCSLGPLGFSGMGRDSCSVYGGIRYACLAKAALALVTFVALPAVLCAPGSHAGQGQLKGQVLEASDDLKLMHTAVRRVDPQRMAQPGAQSASEIIEELECRVGEGIPLEGTDRNVRHIVCTAPHRSQPD
jgi:hypothetical protein